MRAYASTVSDPRRPQLLIRTRHFHRPAWPIQLNAPSGKTLARSLVAALGLYAAWTLCTYLLEGLPRTLLRPDATGARLTYTVVANLLIGISGGFWLLHRFVRFGLTTSSRIGLQGGIRTAISVPAGLLLGLALYALQGAPTWHPVVLANLFAQVLVVSAAEVIVCWVVFGSAVVALLVHKGKLAAYTTGIGASSVLFGLYHFAHSPPFNTIGMVILLSGVGLATGLFYFVARDVYGTLAFHNMLALYGVVTALEAESALGSFEIPMWPVIGTAATTLVLVGAGHIWLSRSGRKGEGILPATYIP